MANNLSGKNESPGSCLARFDQAANLRGILNNVSSGFATLVVLILILTITGVGLEGYIKVNAGLRMINRQAQSYQAVYCAEAGIEWAKAQLLLSSAWPGGSRLVAGKLTEVSISADEDEDGNEGYWVISSATSCWARRKIKVYLKNDSGKWLMTNYQELHR